MNISAVDLLFGSSGALGKAVFRAVIEAQSGSQLLGSFVRRHPKLTREWIHKRPQEIKPMSADELNELLSPLNVSALAQKLAINEKQVERLLNSTFYQGVQLASANGDSVSENAVQRLDADVGSAIQPRTTPR